VKNSI